jgi:predicted CXXCH cytochrome family protein
MRRKSAFVLFLAAAIGLVVVYSMETEPHAFPQDKCRTCHVVDGSGNVAGKQLTASVTALCDRCHAKVLATGYMHPIDVRPNTVRIPADFPLSRSGELVCSTCHDIHASYFTPYGVPSRYLRRLEAGKKFCDACHAGTAAKPGHAAAMGEAHFQSKYIQTSASQSIDPLSKNCISCHDGSYASSVSISAGSWTHGKELMPHDAGSHPIGINYEGARIAKGRRTALRPIAMVDRRVRFFNGKVGCGSCHDPYSTIEKRLVMSDARSKLCFACHLVGGE